MPSLRERITLDVAGRGWLLRARQPRRKRALPVSAAAVRVGIAAAHE